MKADNPACAAGVLRSIVPPETSGVRNGYSATVSACGANEFAMLVSASDALWPAACAATFCPLQYPKPAPSAARLKYAM